MTSRITTTVVAVAATAKELDDTTTYLQTHLADAHLWTVDKDPNNLKVTASLTVDAVDLTWTKETP